MLVMSLSLCVSTLLLCVPVRMAGAADQTLRRGHSTLAGGEDACGTDVQCPSSDKTHVVCATITNEFWEKTEQPVSTPKKHNHCICVGATTFYLNKYKLTVDDCKAGCPVGEGMRINPEDFNFVCPGMGSTEDTFLDSAEFPRDDVWMDMNQSTALATTCIKACCPDLYGTSKKSDGNHQSTGMGRCVGTVFAIVIAAIVVAF